MATVDNNSIFAILQDSAGVVRRIASVVDMQVGTPTHPAELQLTGRVAYNLENVAVVEGDSYQIPENVTITCISVPAGGANIYLPVSPRAGQVQHICDSGNASEASSINIVSSTGALIDGSTSKIISTSRGSTSLVWQGESWISIGASGIGTQGPTGAQGPQGDPGIGTQGSAGAQGPAGSRGSQGDPGIGTQGPAGARGSQGDPGIGTQGPTGAQGPVGTGTQGTQGTQGPQGDPGTPGTAIGTFITFGATIPNDPTSTLYYMYPGGNSTSASLTAVNMTVPIAGTLKNFYVYQNTPGTGANSITYTFYNATTGASATVIIRANASRASNLVSTVPIAAGELLYVSAYFTASVGVNPLSNVTVTMVLS